MSNAAAAQVRAHIHGGLGRRPHGSDSGAPNALLAKPAHAGQHEAQRPEMGVTLMDRHVSNEYRRGNPEKGHTPGKRRRNVQTTSQEDLTRKRIEPA